MQGFYTDPWGAGGNTLLAGPTSYNSMGVAPAATPAPAAGGSPALGYAGAASSIIGMIGNYYLAKTQAKSVKSQLDFQADLNRINARMAERTAQSVLDQGQRAVGRLTMKAGQIKSSQRAAMAANGVALDEGNAQEVLATTDLSKEIDMNAIAADSVRSAWGYRTQGTNYSNAATLQQGSADGISPSAAGRTSLLNDATGVAENWYMMKKAGVF